MRKANFKTLLAATLVVLTFLLAGVGSVEAQTSVSTGATGLYAYPSKVTFVSSSQAEGILAVQVQALQDYVATLPQGSPAYNVAYRASVFYRKVLQSVKGGKNVPDAIMDGVSMFLTDFFIGASFAEKQGLRNEAIGILSTANVPNPNTN